jgi:hypothetical protein
MLAQSIHNSSQEIFGAMKTFYIRQKKGLNLFGQPFFPVRILDYYSTHHSIIPVLQYSIIPLFQTFSLLDKSVRVWLML